MRRMISWASLTMAVASAGGPAWADRTGEEAIAECQAGPAAAARGAKPATKPAAPQTTGKVVTLVAHTHFCGVGTGDPACKGKGLSGSGNQGIPVRVYFDDNGKCVAELPYDLLCVRTGARRAAKPITWRLVGLNGYRFDATHGIDLIDPAKIHTLTSPPYDGGGHPGGARQKFMWVTKAGAATEAWNHLPVVFPDVANPLPDTQCKGIDPIIVNRD